jgi:hypothetical protein
MMWNGSRQIRAWGAWAAATLAQTLEASHVMA